MSKHIGDAVIRPLKNALDDMPVHVRQLAEMFRKHGQKHTHNTGEITDLDATDVPEALRDAWKTGSWHTPDRVVGAGKPNRPYPGEYLDDGYITAHIDRFQDGATRFYRADSLNEHGPGNRGTTFVFPTSEIDDIIDQAGGDPRRLGVMLGLGENYFVDSDHNAVDVVRADFDFADISNGNLRMPRGDEGGANPQWIPGGYLPEGIPEAVFTVHPDATAADPSVGGSFGSYTPFDFRQ